MGFKKDSAVIDTAAASVGVGLPPASVDDGAQAAALPPVEAPTTKEFPADLHVLLANSDKELRIMYQGLYQSIQSSAPLFGSGIVRDLNHWHEIVEQEVDYYMRRVLDRAKKA